MPTAPLTEPNQQIRFLDGLRGLAALYVTISHARWLLWEGYSKFAAHPELYSLFEKGLVYALLFFKFGHSAVLFFFVLSGFVIHLRQAKVLAAGQPLEFNKWAYIHRRARRLYPPLLFSLLLTLGLDLLGRSLGYSIYFKATVDELLNNNLHQYLDLRTFIGTLLFLTDNYVSIYGSNGPLWSLKYEWWFYLLYIPFLRLNQRSVFGSLILIFSLFVLALFGNLWPEPLMPDVFSLFFCWWCGVFLADVYCRRVAIRWSSLLWLTVLFPISLCNFFFIPQINDTLCALGMSGLIAACFYLQEKGFSLWFLEKLKWLGDCSYTLYLIHFPIFTLLSGYLLSANKEVFPQSLMYVLIASSGVLVLAYALHFFLEKPFAGGRKAAIRAR